MSNKNSVTEAKKKKKKKKKKQIFLSDYLQEMQPISGAVRILFREVIVRNAFFVKP